MDVKGGFSETPKDAKELLSISVSCRCRCSDRSVGRYWSLGPGSHDEKCPDDLDISDKNVQGVSDGVDNTPDNRPKACSKCCSFLAEFVAVVKELQEAGDELEKITGKKDRKWNEEKGALEKNEKIAAEDVANKKEAMAANKVFEKRSSGGF